MKIEESTDIIARILHSWGIRYVIASSGSRSLRMVRAAVDNKSLDVRMIVDERVAGFSSLGISECTWEPPALMCTSGS
ncbi:MAG: 2-succinyl-5-enolpyruvyl-6-hydroxy-3-cyclohexene-1-carboxylic-acid synthase, partial [Muribaculaceae bacterium]|nr:2-succinyl-5-enolpyruvyl-6-hydroxy-3-cyclohexene-1-carboxylic-acid synthase [Muribaculaceae bacterium]